MAIWSRSPAHRPAERRAPRFAVGLAAISWHLAAALHYNALGVVAVVLLVIAFATWTYGRATGRTIRGWQHWRWSPMVALVVTVVWFVVRNLDFGPFPALYV